MPASPQKPQGQLTPPRSFAMSPEREARGRSQSSRDIAGKQRPQPVLKWVPAVAESRGTAAGFKSPVYGRRLGEGLVLSLCMPLANVDAQT